MKRERSRKNNEIIDSPEEIEIVLFVEKLEGLSDDISLLSSIFLMKY